MKAALKMVRPCGMLEKEPRPSGYLAVGLAAGAAAAKVERMSARECGAELVRLTLKGE